MVVIDSYSEANFSLERVVKDNHPSDSFDWSAIGQCFTVPASTYTLTSAKFYLRKQGSPTGNAHAVLYAITGTYGTSGKPTGAALATSDNFDVSTLGGGLALITFTFSGAEQYEMQANTYYCIVFENPAAGINSSNYVVAGEDSSSPTHSGNRFTYFNGAWASSSSYDLIFYVYGDEPPPNVMLINIGDSWKTIF